MVKERAPKNYKFFVDTFILYQNLFENTGDLNSLLNLPYPLFNDIILKQIAEKKREKKIHDENLRKVQSGQKKFPKMSPRRR